MDTLTSVKDLLFTLLLKVGVASSIAALLARWNTFRRVLFTEERDPDQKLKLMLFMTPPLILGVSLRLVGFPYRFADLSLEGAFLMGLLGGRVGVGGGGVGVGLVSTCTGLKLKLKSHPARSAVSNKQRRAPVLDFPGGKERRIQRLYARGRVLD